MADRQYVHYTVDEGVATLVIDFPPVNTLNTHTLSELDEALDEIYTNPQAKAIVLTGGGKMAFVAGADISEINGFVQAGDLARAQSWVDRSKAVFNKIENGKKPVIAAINGVTLGGGLELAMSCHVRLAADTARLGQPEIDLGIIPAWGGTQRLTRIVGPSKATWMILTGEPVTAQEAKAWGLVNQVVPGDQLLRQAVGLARKIASKSAVVIAAALTSIGEGLQVDLTQGLAVEGQQCMGLVTTFDAAEGLSAFLEKRPPQFQDR
jgi:enoyl-CoA hydratase/carnithine racemase